MASPSRGHEKRGTQSECLPVSTAGNLARLKSGTWVVTARSRACKKCERRSASQRNEKNVRLQKSTAGEKLRSRASLREQTYDFPENRKAIE